MVKKKDKLNKLQKKFIEFQNQYLDDNDVCFDEFKDTIKFGDFSMGDIVELYGALAYTIDGDIVERAMEECDEEGWQIWTEHKCLGETILKKSLLEELQNMDSALREENEHLKEQLKQAETKITECKKVLGVLPKNNIAAPF